MYIEKNKIAILIISCDKYSDLWEPCTKMFNKFWPDCIYDKFILSNFKEYPKDGFQSILVGKDETWSQCLKIALKILQSKYQYVFTMVEDYFFAEKIDSNYISNMFDAFIKNDGDFLSLFKLPSKLQKVNNYFGKLENKIPYRQSVGFTLWKIKTLIDILNDNENAWDFEKKGVVRGFKYENYFCVYKNYKVLNLVIKGKIAPKEYRVLNSFFPEIVIERQIMNRKEIFVEKFREIIITTFLFYTPSWLKRVIYFSK